MNAGWCTFRPVKVVHFSTGLDSHPQLAKLLAVKLKLLLAVVVACVALVAVACGGGEKSIADVKSCLLDNASATGYEDMSNDPGIDVYATSAGKGYVQLDGNGDQIQVLVENDADAASAKEKVIQSAAQAFGGEIPSYTTGNVVVYGETLSEEGKALLKKCGVGE